MNKSNLNTLKKLNDEIIKRFHKYEEKYKKIYNLPDGTNFRVFTSAENIEICIEYFNPHDITDMVILSEPIKFLISDEIFEKYLDTLLKKINYE